MTDERIYVDGELFLGRLEEQSRIRQVLNAILSAGNAEDPPYIFLLQGEGGMGKSKLLRRLRNIASTESPFEAEVQTVLADWEIERNRSIELKVPRDSIPVDIILGHFHRVARDAGWGHQFTDYQNTVRFLNQVEEKVAEIAEQEIWGPRYEIIRRLDARSLAILVRGTARTSSARTRSVPLALMEIFQSGDEALRSAREQAEGWLINRAGLEPEEEEIYCNPYASLARALGLGFARVAQSKPILLLLDTYEIVSVADPWIRALIKASGPRVIWVIASGEALADPGEAQSQAGYAAEFSERLDVYHLPELNAGHVAEYLRFRAPDRLLTPDDAEAIYAATRGVPLAMQVAADLWAGGVFLKDITEGISGGSPADEIIEQFSQRLLVHCDDPSDRQALFLLAIQRRPDEEVQAAVLRAEKGPFDLQRRIDRLKIRYLCVRSAGAANLHESVAVKMRQYIFRHRIRFIEEVKAISTKATKAINAIREELEAGFPRLEDRFQSSEWREAMLDSVHWAYWHNEFNAWRHFNRYFVDSLGYDWNLARSLLQIVERVQPILGRDGRRRLQILEAGMASQAPGDMNSTERKISSDLEAEMAMLAELDRWLNRYGGKDLNAAERRAILDLRQGELYARREQYKEALDIYLQAERNLPVRGESLTRQLAEAFEVLGEKLAWRRDGTGVRIAEASAEAERALRKALTLGRRRASVYHTLGAVQVRLGKLEASLENLLQAVTLNPGNREAWEDLAGVYFKEGRYEKAVPAYRRAIELDPRLLKPQMALALCFRLLEREDDFAEQVEALRDRVAKQDEYTRACYESVCGNLGPALAFLKIALEGNQVMRESVRDDLLFEPIRDQLGFQQLVGV